MVSGVSNNVSSGNSYSMNNFKGDYYVKAEDGTSYFINPAAVENLNEKYNGVDKVSFTHNKNTEESAPRQLDEAAKKEIMLSARTKASGWAVFGGFLSTLYYGLRSNDTIAEKYNLDAEKDKDFIKKVKKEQVIWTIPGAISGPLSVIAWIYNKCCDSKDIDV